MSTEIKKEIQLEIAHVLFIDIVGYSKLLINEQRALLDALNQIVRGTEEFQKAEAAGRLIKIPTGDGMALVFYKSPEEPVECALEISRALKTYPNLPLRMGVHSGPVSGMADVNERVNVAGAGINMAQRVMDCGDAGHILLSKRVAEDLEHYGHWQPHLHDLGECEVKHGLRVYITNLYTEELGNAEVPEKFRQARETQAPASPAFDAKPAGRARALITALIIVAATVVAGSYILLTRSGSSKRAPTEAEKLTQQARALIDDDPLAVRENYRLAEELGQRAVQLNPTDAEAWATLARASLSIVADRYDDTPARREAAASQAERAIRLAPDSLEAGLAMVFHLMVSRQFSEGESRARELLRRFPTDQRAVFLLASLHPPDRKDETRELLRQHANTPQGLTRLRDWEAYDHYDKNELVEADALLDQLFAGKPTAISYLTRLLTLWAGWGDLPAAGEFVEKIPSQLLLEDAFASHAASVWMEMGQTEKALETLRRIPREFLEEKLVIRPKGLLTGSILQAAGRTEAARVEWQQALTLVEKRLAAEPGRADWVQLKALLLGHLGEKAEGQKQINLWREMSGIPAADSSQAHKPVDVQTVLGNHEVVIQAFQTVINSKKGRWLSPFNRLRHDPLYAPIRSDPRVQEVIATGEAWLKDLREAKTRTATGGSASPVSSSLVTPEKLDPKR